MAITKFDQFDFLIDIVPRDELKPPKRQVSQKSVAAAAARRPPCILFFTCGDFQLGSFKVLFQ